jgi:2-oxoglutarate ferredoxin oxidoreductase subunit alpha
MQINANLDRGISVAITGSGGSGAVTAGLILLAAAARAGHYGLLTRSAGPQIRGGESVAMVRFASRPVECMDDRFDVLLGLDWNNVERFIDELPLDGDSLILCDEQIGPPPGALASVGARVSPLGWRRIADQVSGGRLNMAALGSLGSAVGLPLSALEAGARSVIGDKGEGVLEGSLNCIRAGHGDAPATVTGGEPPPARLNLSGNEAAGLGALRGGVRFVAAYPITPASEMLEWLAPRLELVGGSLLQAEDELASVNMIIGASFGGVPALTATSGPGLSLMMEGLGLAVASETPVVVANVQRGGPSTGIPTKSEQSDLNIALYGFHGDAPHLVLAPHSIRDCVFTFQWAVRLAEHLQTVAIVLSDQALGQSRAVVDTPEQDPSTLERKVEADPDEHYRRYALSADGVSPMTLPGTPGGAYTADGLEHSPAGIPSSMARDHAQQSAKRLHKLTGFDYGPRWADIEGDGGTCLITWGSTSGAVRESARRLQSIGRPTRVIALRLILPLRRAELARALEGSERVLVVEQNQSGQLFRFLHSEQSLPAHARSLARPGPLPIRPGEVVAAVCEEC